MDALVKLGGYLLHRLHGRRDRNGHEHYLSSYHGIGIRISSCETGVGKARPLRIEAGHLVPVRKEVLCEEPPHPSRGTEDRDPQTSSSPIFLIPSTMVSLEFPRDI